MSNPYLIQSCAIDTCLNYVADSIPNCSVFELYKSLIDTPSCEIQSSWFSQTQELECRTVDEGVRSTVAQSESSRYTFDMYMAHPNSYVVQRKSSASLRFGHVLSSWYDNDGSFRKGLCTGGMYVWGLCMCMFGKQWALDRQPGCAADEREAYGITDGIVACDLGLSANKVIREENFPFSLLYKGASFRCRDGEASVVEDKYRILKTIGADESLLDQSVHGVVAACAIRRAFEEGPEAAQLFLEALRAGCNRFVSVDLVESPVDTVDTVLAILDAVHSCACIHLALASAALNTVDGAALSRLDTLTTLDLSGCCNLITIPEEIGHLQQLCKLELSACIRLKSLPSSLCRLSKLECIGRSGCFSLLHLPDLSNLTKLEIEFHLVHDLFSSMLLPGSLPTLALLITWLVRACMDCAWGLTPSICAGVCWVAVFATVQVPIQFDDARSKCCQVVWKYSGYKPFPSHPRNMLVLGAFFLFAAIMCSGAVWFTMIATGHIQITIDDHQWQD